MIVTTYTCDKCGHEQTDSNQMWNVAIQIGTVRYGNHGSGNPSALWCRACVMKIGLLPPPKEGPAPADPPPTLEDMIRDIAQSAVSQ